MAVTWIIVKSLFLIVGIVYTFSNFGKLIRGCRIGMVQQLLMAVGIVGFTVIHFWLGY